MQEESISTLEELKGYLRLSPFEELRLRRVLRLHPMLISSYYASLIDWNDPKDPIKRMAVPSCDELNLEGCCDTSGEAENTKLPGLQHKYSETALLLATNVCAMYCRHCFRKRLVGLPTQETLKRLEDAANYIKNHHEINNVLVSGGDPLTLCNRTIEKFLEVLTRISHLNFIRIGTKVPVTFPSRLDDQELLDIFEKYSKSKRRIYVVTQFNHPREISPQSTKAVSDLINRGVLINNQTVLLKGVNDKPEVLASLMNKLVSIGVSPYYVFQCRPVSRVKHHFQVPISKGLIIVEKAKARCNGFSKRFKYIMSHVTGKIEILGIMKDEIFFKYHEAKNRVNLGKVFKVRLNETAGWLDDFDEYSDVGKAMKSVIELELIETRPLKMKLPKRTQPLIRT